MLPVTRLLPAALAALALTGCGGAPAASSPPAASSDPGRPVTPTGSTPASSSASPCVVQHDAPPSTLAADFPTALAFAPDGRLFYAERSGRVMVWQGGSAHTFATVSTVTTESDGGYSERGLLGLTVSPTFATDRHVFAFYSDADRSHQQLIRWTDCGGVATETTRLVTLPAGSDCCHKGGRIKFGVDGKLYVTLGDEHASKAAQATADVRGKLLRYNPDGSVPDDNPFGPGNPAWAYGLRNPFGLAISSGGQIALTNNGPSGDAGSPGTGYDTAVLNVARGGGYGWPACYGYGHLIGGRVDCGNGQILPDWSSESSTVVPTGAAFIDSAGPAALAGHLVFCTLNGGMLVLSPGSPHASVTQGPQGCRLDVAQAPDHAVYYSDTGHIYRAG